MYLNHYVYTIRMPTTIHPTSIKIFISHDDILFPIELYINIRKFQKIIFLHWLCVLSSRNPSAEMISLSFVKSHFFLILNQLHYWGDFWFLIALMDLSYTPLDLVLPYLDRLFRQLRFRWLNWNSLKGDQGKAAPNPIVC